MLCSMSPEEYIRRGFTDRAEDFHNTSTAWHYGGMWLVYTLNEDGSKNIAAQSMEAVYGDWWIRELKKLQDALDSDDKTV